ncbi:LysR family transcriptional regulator [Roseateles oligotrophus]|uniref:LysR family transcriptional regulator n=1 Tax=Roseateles oligotrophus TaxID=1769250 RepID=A0ABT2YBA5_9BURK|nr:LysR family transcriptional regulator [Roseateles oligotrophus]MCV2367581.1 LysR family transcriptional regulator [Roseateles oligotrophus]
MIAKTQYKMTPADLAVVLALVRGSSLAGAGERVGADASTVFRSLQRIERGLGRALFERSRAGYIATELAAQLAEHAEQLEATLEAARNAVETAPSQVSGLVRISSTDTILHGLVAPALRSLQLLHPLLGFDLHTGNELVSLTRRDADIAVRATKRPPQHLVGKQIGPIRVALYAAKAKQAAKPNIKLADVEAGRVDWIAPDEALPEHPSVVWRKRNFPKVLPRYRVGSILSVLELVALGMGVGIAPLFLAEGRSDVIRLTEPLDECETELWLLTHPESRHLRRVSAVYGHLALTLQMP